MPYKKSFPTALPPKHVSFELEIPMVQRSFSFDGTETSESPWPTGGTVSPEKRTSTLSFFRSEGAANFPTSWKLYTLDYTDLNNVVVRFEKSYSPVAGGIQHERKIDRDHWRPGDAQEGANDAK